MLSIHLLSYIFRVILWHRPLLIFIDIIYFYLGAMQSVYSACYAPAKEIMQECYNEVRSGNEIRSVVMQGARLNDINTGKIDGTFTWKVITALNATMFFFPPEFFPLIDVQKEEEGGEGVI